MKIAVQKDMGMDRFHKWTLKHNLNIFRCVDGWNAYKFHQAIEDYSTSRIFGF